MIIESIDRAPYMIYLNQGFITDSDGNTKPGKVLGLFAQLRKAVGVIQAKQKPGMKFKTRANDDLINELRPAANELGLLIYPTEADGTGFVVEDGTLATVKLSIIVQAVEDGSCLVIAGFGLGADSQDKAGGKAGTYAFKAALLQALLATGTDDTDDTDTPIAGGVRKKTSKPVTPTFDVVSHALQDSKTQSDYKAARELLKRMNPDDIVTLRETAKEAKERCGVTD